MTNIITLPAWKVSDEYIRLRWIMFFIGEYFAINIFSMIKNISISPIFSGCRSLDIYIFGEFQEKM